MIEGVIRTDPERSKQLDKMYEDERVAAIAARERARLTAEQIAAEQAAERRAEIRRAMSAFGG